MPAPPDPEQLKRWRLILGAAAQEDLDRMGACNLSEEQRGMDEALAAIYDESSGEEPGPRRGGGRSAGLGPSAPNLARWLGDIRGYFKEDVVTVIQNDAIARKGLTQLLFEPEMLKQVEPNPQLVGTLMSLKGRIPERTKDTARQVVQTVVDQIKRRLEQGIRQAVLGALNRREHSPIPSSANIDWKWTVSRNLKHYQPSLGTLVPEKVHFHARSQRTNKWNVIVCMDQSGSMAESVVYGSVTGAIFASLPAMKTRVVAFDTEVVDLTEQCGNDPVDMIFGVQLGGGTDINKAVSYCARFVTDPAQTIFFLISDLIEGGNQSQLIRRMHEMAASGVRVICLLALSDSGIPIFDEQVARKLSAGGIPCFGCTPNKLPELVEGVLKRHDLKALAARLSTKKPG
ncbi:MAG: VWA domain-containing protein [Verrucomicrobia bacterium]|nr:VWA domain-containing protein [Verrucomicrobiota bacterium]